MKQIYYIFWDAEVVLKTLKLSTIFYIVWCVPCVYVCFLYDIKPYKYSQISPTIFCMLQPITSIFLSISWYL